MKRLGAWLLVCGLTALPALGSRAQVVPPTPTPPTPPSAEPAQSPAVPVTPAPAPPPTEETILPQPAPATSLDRVETDDVGKPKVPWTASFEWTQTYNAAGLTRGGTQTYNPEYSWGFKLSLGYVFDERTSVTLSQPVSVELTDSDENNSREEVTTTRQEWWLLDTALDVSHSLPVYELAPAHKLKLSGSLRLLIPISKTSQARTTVLGSRAALAAAYTYDHLLQGFDAGLSLGYLHRFTRANTIETETSFPCFRVGSDLSESCTHLGGSSVTADLVALGVSVGLKMTSALHVALALAIGWNRGHGFEAVPLAIETGEITVKDNSVSHWRNVRSIGLSVDYAFTDWFSATAGITNDFSELGPDGEPRGPFHALDMQLGLGLRVSFDQLYLATLPKPKSTP